MRWLILNVVIVLGLAVQWVLLPSPPENRTVGDDGDDNVEADIPDVPEPVRAGADPALVDLISERPLFSETRRPPVAAEEVAEEDDEDDAEEAAEPEPPDPLEARLEAVMGGSGNRWVLVRTDDDDVERLHVGDRIDGWELRTVDSGRVVFVHGDHTQELRLRDY